MRGLTFEVEEQVVPSAPERVDVACFVGFVRRRPDAPVSAPIARFLSEAGWSSGSTQRVDLEDPDDPLLDVPLPFDSFEAFSRHFAWEERSSNPDDGACYLGAAVRSFFAQGGRKCYVVAVGEPLDVSATRSARLAALSKLLVPDTTPVERSTWHGVSHLFGLEDVSFLALPDLPELVAADPSPAPLPHEQPLSAPQFVECAEEPDTSAPVWHTPERSAPRCDLLGYQQWGDFLRGAADLFRQSRSHLREVHLVVALPRPSPELQVELPGGKRVSAEQELARYLQQNSIVSRFESAFVQLAYPWARTPGSVALPEQFEPLDGAFVGILARNALMRGTFRSAVGLSVADLLELSSVPTLVDRALRGAGAPLRGLVERVSLVGPTPRGLRVLSDVTSSPLEAHRIAPASRLIAVVLRAARQVGLDGAFEPSNESTWDELRRALEDVLGQLYEAGALQGDTPEEAFSVRCDLTTMTQDDLDAGRLIVEVQLQPAAVLERVRVMLSMAEGGVAFAQGGGG